MRKSKVLAASAGVALALTAVGIAKLCVADAAEQKQVVLEILERREKLVRSAVGNASIESWYSLDADLLAAMDEDARPRDEHRIRKVDWKFKDNMYREESVWALAGSPDDSKIIVGYDGNEAYLYRPSDKFASTLDKLGEAVSGMKLETSPMGATEVARWLQLEHMYGRSSANEQGSFGEKPLSKVLAAADVSLIGEDEIDGVTCSHFKSTSDTGFEESWWVAPSLNGLLIKNTKYWARNGTETTWTTRVTKTRDFGSGIIMPTTVEKTASVKLSSGKMVTAVRKVFTVEPLDVNPTIDGQAFKFDRPSDVEVVDGQQGVSPSDGQ